MKNNSRNGVGRGIGGRPLGLLLSPTYRTVNETTVSIGVLALQGAFSEHLAMFRKLGVEGREVRLPQELAGLDGLVIPGGESTAMGLLAREYGLLEPLKAFGAEKAVWGTCAGAILLSSGLAGPGEERLGLMDIDVERNAFGRQVESFQTDLEVAVFDSAGADQKPFPGVFIRAPLIAAVNEEEVEILSSLPDGTIVAARQGKLIATVFHPELTRDDRFHSFFLSLAAG